MKKSILSTAVLAVSLFSFSAMAQKPADCNTTTCPVKECPATACAPGKQCLPGRPEVNHFSGLNLTQEQKDKLATLKQQRKAKCEANAKAQENRGRQCDSIARCGKKEYLDGVKAILTPDQYVVFLENVVLSQPLQRGPRIHAMKKGYFKRGDMKRAEKVTKQREEKK